MSKASTETCDSGSIYTYVPDEEFSQLLDNLSSNQTTSTPNTSANRVLISSPTIIEQEIASEFSNKAGPSSESPHPKKLKFDSIFPQVNI